MCSKCVLRQRDRAREAPSRTVASLTATSETSSTDVIVSRPWLSIGSRIPVLVLEASESEQDDTLIHGRD